MKLLIVDDDADIVESVRLGFGLQWREVDVISADNADDALRRVELASLLAFCARELRQEVFVDSAEHVL